MNTLGRKTCLPGAFACLFALVGLISCGDEDVSDLDVNDSVLVDTTELDDGLIPQTELPDNGRLGGLYRLEAFSLEEGVEHDG